MVKTYLNYEPAKTFSALMTSSENVNKIVKSEKYSVCLLSVCNEILIVSKVNSGEEIFRVFPSNSKSSARITCLEAFSVSKNLTAFWNEEVSDGEGMDDPFGLFEDKKALCTVQRSTSFANTSNKSFLNKDWIIYLGYEDGSHSLFDLHQQKYIFNLESHDNSISMVDIIQSQNTQLIVCTCSVDKEIKIHDLLLKQYLHSIKSHYSKVVSVSFYGKYLFTLSLEGILRVFDYSIPVLVSQTSTSKQNCKFLFLLEINNSMVAVVSSGDEDLIIFTIDNEQGSFNEPTIFKRTSFAKILQMKQVNQNSLVLLLDNQQLEILTILDQKEVLKKYKRKVQRKVKDLPSEEEYISDMSNYLIFKKHLLLDHKFKSFDLVLRPKSNDFRILLFTNNNFFIQAHLNISEGVISNKKQSSDLYHQNVITSMELSHNDHHLVSTSKEGVMIWDSEESLPIRKLPIQNVLCVVFFPKDKYVCLGDKEGNIYLIETLKGNVVDVLNLGPKAVIDICVNIKIVKEKIQLFCLMADLKLKTVSLILKTNKELGLKCVHNLPLKEEPINIKTNPNGDNVLISYMDNSLQILYSDTLKEKQKIYGHSLPINDFDCSTDEYVLASVAGDKSLRIWDKDFGNCRRIINKCHDTNPTSIKIIKDTHYALTSGKDNFVKYWDLDTFQLIKRYEFSSNNCITSIAVSSIGHFFIAGGFGKTLRQFMQTREQILAMDTKQEVEDEENVLQQLQDDENKDIYFKSKDKNNEDETVVRGNRMTRLKKFEVIKDCEELIEIIELLQKDDFALFQQHEEKVLKLLESEETSNLLSKRGNILYLNLLIFRKFILSFQ